MMNKLKIAYIGQRGVPPTFGGIERYVDEIVKRLPRDEVETYTYCRRHYVENNFVDYTKQLFVPSLETKGFEAFSHSFFSAIDSFRHSFDIVHFQALGPSLFSCIPKIKGVKVVVTIHGLDWQRAKWGKGAKAVLKAGDWMAGHTASALISVSKRLKEYYENKYKTDVFFVPIGFSEPKFMEIDEMNRKFGIEPFKYILFLNRLVPEKGIHYLIEAFKGIKRDDFKLVIAGSAFQGDKYVVFIKELAKDDKRIVFTDYVTRDEMHELYSNAYFFALPSELEGMPAVVLEALSHKCPVLISDVEEIMDIVKTENRMYGFAHKNKDVGDIRAQIRFLLDHPELVEEMRQPGYDHVQKEYSWDKAVKMTYDVYKHVI
nr:similar to capsular polysaccharide biosynthesis glycosyltransferase CapM [Candidatus Kuenenia stuttgartiensis]